MSEKQLELELWLTREKLAEATLELWQYKRMEAQQHVLRVAKELEQLKGNEYVDQSS